MENKKTTMPSDDHDARNFAMAAVALSTIESLFTVLTDEQNRQLHTRLKQVFEIQTSTLLSSGLPDAGIQRYEATAALLLQLLDSRSSPSTGT